MTAQKKKGTKTKTKKRTSDEKGDKKSIEILVSVPKDASVESIAESASVVVKEPDGSQGIVEAVVVEEAVDQSGNEEVSAVKTEKVEIAVTLAKEDNQENQGESGIFNKKIFVWGIGLIVCIGIFAGFLWLAYERGIAVGQQNEQKKLSASPTPEAPTPTPSPSEETKPSTYIIKVLNGSGIAGEAAKVKALLEKENYSISSIGNGDSTSTGETIIQAKNAVGKTWLNNLKKLLSQTYVVSSDVQSLSADEKVDVVITVGSKKVQ